MPRVPSRITGNAVTQVQGPTPFARVATGDYQAQSAQRAAEAATAPSRGLPFGDGNLIAGITMTAATPLDVSHRLGRQYQGWFVVRLQASAACSVIELSTLAASMRDRQIRLQASANATVDVWVF